MLQGNTVGKKENKNYTFVCKIMVADIPLAIRQARQLTESSSSISDVSVSPHDENRNCIRLGFIMAKVQ